MGKLGASVLRWWKRRRPVARPQFEQDAPKVQPSVLVGRYASLYTYLENRFANTVVRTLFGSSSTWRRMTSRSWSGLAFMRVNAQL